MRWWSRNWPDVIIVFLILVLIAGFVLVLRGGLHQAAPGQAAGSPAGATPRQAPAQRTSPLAVSPATATPSASPPAAASTAPGASSTPSAPNAVPTIPAQQAQPSQATSSSSEAKTSRRRSGPASPAPQPVAGRAPSPKSLISAHHPPTGADYRISAGVFRIHGDARRMAAAVEKTGFPAYILTSSGHQYAVLTGPFATRAAAEQALKELKVATPNLFIYAPNPGSSSPAASAFSAHSGAAPARKDLQVGAFSRQSDASRMEVQLRAAGLQPTLRVQGSLTQVLLGPFGPSGLQRTEHLLAKLKIPYFEVPPT